MCHLCRIRIVRHPPVAGRHLRCRLPGTHLTIAGTESGGTQGPDGSAPPGAVPDTRPASVWYPPAMSSPGPASREKIFQWLLTLLDRSADSWSPSQRAFLLSLLEGEEGTKTLVQMAVTTARLRASGLKPEELGPLWAMHQAIADFWDDPSPETYRNLHTAGRFLDSDS